MKTHHTLVGLLIRSVLAVLLGIGLALLLNTKAVAGDIHLDVIKTRADLYKDVTVTGHNATDIFIVHSGGMANVKIKDLDPETLWRLGLGEKPVEPGSPEALAAANAATNQTVMPAALAKVLESASASNAAGQEAAQKLEADATAFLSSLFNPESDQFHQLLPVLLGILAGFLFFYLFFCYCLKLIVQKTGTKPGLMVWLPILQLIPLLRAARMSMVWFLFWISPLLVAAAVPLLMSNGVTPEASKAMQIVPALGALASLLQLITFIVWCVKIAQARGKSVWVGILLLLPITNLFAFLYLAFSSGESGMEYQHDEDKIVIQSAFSEA